jgi:hypothetical protein
MGLLEQRKVQANSIPTYSLGKKKKKRRKFLIPSWIVVISVILLLLAIAIYMPPMLLPDSDPFLFPSKALATNELALSTALTYLKNHPDEDFDEDGLINEKEASSGTGAYSIDTDGDGVTDYAELYITETSPTIKSDVFVRHIRSIDSANGKQVNSPVKVHNVVMWPDDYTSRAVGAVVRTFDGYRFCNFTGWVQFPEGEFAYKIENGIHIELEKNSQGYFHIDGGIVTVQVYNEPLPMKYVIEFIGGKKLQIADDFFGDILYKVLPNSGRGLIVCRKPADIDEGAVDSAIGNKTAIYVPETILLEDSRFQRNANKLSDLADIFSAIDGGSCVVLSLYSHEIGEAFVLAYGYTYRGNIFVADIETGEPIGAINFVERATRLLDKSGEVQQYAWFSFDGCGFSSDRGNRMTKVLEVLPPKQ